MLTDHLDTIAAAVGLLYLGARLGWHLPLRALARIGSR
jgi:hypothetical protein